MAYKIGPGCSTCHSCYFACPVHAIGFVDSEYAIDESKCIHCGTCAKVCPTGLIYDPSVTPAVQSHDPIELEADLVVCGGGAGLTAAVHFAQRTGGRVVLLEKGKRCGGDTNLSHGFAKSARWSKMYEAAGLPDLREQFVEKLMSTHPDFDRKLLRDAQYALCDMLDMLFDLGGYEELFNITSMPFGPDAGIPFVDFPKRWKYNLKSDDHSMGPGWQGYETWAEQLEGETAYNRAACKGETLEELAEKMGADPAVFTAEIARYNAFCAAGRDEDFGKDPAKLLPIQQGPFYACFIARFNENTMGGIVNDTNLNVVREDGSPIPGLYAVGNTCVGLFTEDFMDKFGDCAWAMASGYLSATRAAEFLGK